MTDISQNHWNNLYHLLTWISASVGLCPICLSIFPRSFPLMSPSLSVSNLRKALEYFLIWVAVRPLSWSSIPSWGETVTAVYLAQVTGKGEGWGEEDCWGESEKLGDNPKHKSTVSGPYSARRTSNHTKRYCEAFCKLLFHFRKVFIVHHNSKYTLCFSRFTQGKIQRRVAAGI